MSPNWRSFEKRSNCERMIRSFVSHPSAQRHGLSIAVQAAGASAAKYDVRSSLRRRQGEALTQFRRGRHADFALSEQAIAITRHAVVEPVAQERRAKT